MSISEELFRPIRIGGTLLRNRLVIAPTSTGFDPIEQTDALCEFYERRTADRGAGAVIFDGISPHFTGKRSSADPLLTPRYASVLRTLTDRLHESDTKAVLQLRHYGASCDHPFALSASCLYNPITQRTAHRTPSLLLRPIIKSYGKTAYRAVHEAGFDGVEIHGALMSLPNLFFSPKTNSRRDAWGVNHRGRLALEIVECVRSYLGPSPILSYRFPLMDLTPQGAAWHEIVALVHALIEAGVNHLSFDFGVAADAVPVDGPMTPPNTWTPFMERIAEEVSVPVSFGKNLGTPAEIGKLLERRETGLIELIEPLVADPDWSRKIADQTTSDIVPCVRCPSGCRMRSSVGSDGKPIFCPMNPIDFSPYKSGLNAAKDAAPVLIVGAGPAGLMCAWIAARRGFQVTLCEARDTLGGGLAGACAIEGLASLGHLADKYGQRVRHAGVDIRTSCRVDADWIAKNAPNHQIILATGTRPKIPDLPGLGSPNVLTYESLLFEKHSYGRRIAIVGDNSLGLLMAQYLITPHDSSARSSEAWLRAWGIGDPSRHAGGMLGFIPCLPDPLCTVYLFGERQIRRESVAERGRRSGTVLQWLKMNGVRTFSGVNIESINPQEIQISFGENRECRDAFRVDHIVLAAGFEPNNDLSYALRSRGIAFREIGSVSSPHEALNLSWSFQEGFKAAEQL